MFFLYHILLNKFQVSSMYGQLMIRIAIKLLSQAFGVKKGLAVHIFSRSPLRHSHLTTPSRRSSSRLSAGEADSLSHSLMETLQVHQCQKASESVKIDLIIQISNYFIDHKMSRQDSSANMGRGVSQQDNVRLKKNNAEHFVDVV